MPKGLVVSPVGAYEGSNTSRHRVEALRNIGHEIVVIDSHQVLGPIQSLTQRCRARLFRAGFRVSLEDFKSINQKIITELEASDFDYLWLERGLVTNTQTLRQIRERFRRTLVIGFSVDDMYGRHNQSQNFLNSLGFYDVFVTTKSYNVEELRRLGCRRTLFTDNGFSPDAFHPVDVSAQDVLDYGSDISFAGTYEEDRARSLCRLASEGFSVRVWGNGWGALKRPPTTLRLEKRPAYEEAFRKVCSASKINLGFLRKLNRDLQTTRSVEIPACGGMLLAERSDEHVRLFLEDEEAAFFSTDEELIAQCAAYLENDQVRKTVAKRGYERCINGGYTNENRLSKVFERLL